jgi:monofunctional biosynthetic peptidoglycan transglycosylase
VAGQKRRSSRKRSRRILIRAILIAVAAAAAFSIWTWLSLPDVSGLKARNPQTTSLIRFRAEQAKRAGKTFSSHLEWTAFDRFPDLLKRSILVSEDASFYSHRGIDYTELKASIRQNLKEKRFARGGSTITQQLAKNLYLSTEKTFGRKIKEFLIARRLEMALSKDRIFSLYLNVIELGPGVFGFPAAARFWFGKDVGELSLEEIVRLTAIIPRPLKSDPRRNDGWMRFKGRWIADTLASVEAITDAEREALIRSFEGER